MRPRAPWAWLPTLLLAPLALRAQDPVRISVTARSAPDSLVGLDGRRQAVERGTLTIRERWSGAVDTIELEVSYLRLPARNPANSAPIVFLMGGPGVPASIIGRIPPYWNLFDSLRNIADVILLDQRGVGLSRPSVDCPRGAQPGPDFLASLQSLVQGLGAAYAPCVAAWRERGLPPEILSTREVATDIDAIREELGVPRLSLLGFSYGTRLALEYVTLYPEHVDRVVLQGTLGFEHGIRLPSTLDSLLDRVSAVAARDSVARALVPDLRAALVARFAALDRAPLRVTVRPGGGRGLALRARGLLLVPRT